MLYIAHRGLLGGPNEKTENHPVTIDLCFEHAHYAEIDLRVINGEFWLGHDKPQYPISLNWLLDNRFKLIIHAKTLITAETLWAYGTTFHWFWHQEDHMTLTSHGWIWAYPGKQPVKGSIAVLPELHDDDCSLCIGICTDYVYKYKEMYK